MCKNQNCKKNECSGFQDHPRETIYATMDDFQHMKEMITDDLKNMLSNLPCEKKSFLKSYEVRNILGCSQGTLRNLCKKGILCPTKVGGTWYYSSDKVYNLLDMNIVNS